MEEEEEEEEDEEEEGYIMQHQIWQSEIVHYTECTVVFCIDLRRKGDCLPTDWFLQSRRAEFLNMIQVNISSSKVKKG
jgi:hypothetical protein